MGLVCNGLTTISPTGQLCSSLFGLLLGSFVFQQNSLQAQELVEDDCVSQAFSHTASVITMFNSTSRVALKVVCNSATQW